MALYFILHSSFYHLLPFSLPFIHFIPENLALYLFFIPIKSSMVLLEGFCPFYLDGPSFRYYHGLCSLFLPCNLCLYVIPSLTNLLKIEQIHTHYRCILSLSLSLRRPFLAQGLGPAGRQGCPLSPAPTPEWPRGGKPRAAVTSHHTETARGSATCPAPHREDKR